MIQHKSYTKLNDITSYQVIILFTSALRCMSYAVPVCFVIVTVWKEEVDCFNTSIVFRESSEERGMESRGRV